MAAIVYLDADDEITSAASRIRTAGADRVALVLPFGSRVATSRINFRLLAREAQANGRRLDIVAPDASARALAASAGLPVFTSVGEYEAAIEGADGNAGTATSAGLGAAAAGAAAVAAAASSAGPSIGAAVPPPVARPVDPAADTVPVDRGTSPAGGGVGATRPGSTVPPAEPTRVVGPAPAHGPRPDEISGPPKRRGPRRAFVALALLVLVLLGVGAVGAVTILPSADITVTPRIEAVGPISFTVSADPDATVVDPASGVIPATTLSVPVTASGDFPATGKKIVKEKAKGSVRFTNCDPSAAYTLPQGTIVRTAGGVGFATGESVLLAVAGISGTPPNIRVKCTTSDVAVTALEAGPAGNVDAGEIRVVPARYNRSLVRVTNPAATTGGSRQEFPRVVQADVDAAMTKLTADLQTEFEAQLSDPATVPEGTTVFPATATLGTATPDPDPASLVGQEVATFTLALSATGTVQAVDASPIEAIAEQRLKDAVGEGYELIDGSTSVTVGNGTPVNGVISFPVDATARQVRPLDAATLERQVLGLSKADAQTVLGGYGDVKIVLWPDWVTSVPAMDSRVTLIVAPPVDAAGPSSAPSPTASPGGGGQSGGSASPAASPLEVTPADESPSEPVPSG